jgi:SAM-dependent methyltransferase
MTICHEEHGMEEGKTLPATEDAQEFYDNIWFAWRDMQRYAPAPRYLRRMVMRELSRLSFKSLLDVGCGEGSLLQMVGKAYPTVTLGGSELSETALRFCRQALPNAKFFKLDLQHEGALDDPYDVVLCVQVLEHLSDDVMALEKLRALCRRAAVISVPGGKLDEHGRKNGHYRHYTKQDLVEKMSRSGFRVIRAFNFGWPVHSLLFRQLVRWLPRESVEKVGLGAYSPVKRTIMKIGDLAYFLNLSFIGTEIIAVGVPR